MFTTDERFIVIDTETTNSIDFPFCYDVGFAVVDMFGHVYKKYSFIVKDIFFDEDLMTSAYFSEKIPNYLEDIKSKKRKVATFYHIKKTLWECVRKYDINIILAHNARFDYRSLNLTQRFLTSSKYRYFFPFGVEIWDTLKMSRTVLKDVEEYTEFCITNNYLTKRNCKRYTAEILYRFISGNNDFEESHTGLEDVLIEKEIFTYCLSKMPDIDGILWAREQSLA